MSDAPSLSPPAAPPPRKDWRDCLTCRVIGTSAFLGCSIYALHIQRDEAKRARPLSFVESYPWNYGLRYGPRWLGVVSAGFFGLAVMRATLRNDNQQ